MSKKSKIFENLEISKKFQSKPKVCVLITDGTNCDKETAYSFNLVGGDAEIVHINALKSGYNPVNRKKISLHDYHILAIPGGFSEGDYVKAGKILAQDLKDNLGEKIQKFIDDEKIIIGICNGFQVLVKSGFLPMLDGKTEQTTTLTYNSNGNFEDRWVNLVSPDNNCIWTKGVNKIYLPIAHGEGRFEASEETIEQLFKQGLVVYQYADSDGNPTMKSPDNPNNSMKSIAGICDPTGRIFGLMPHPERYNAPQNHPQYTLQKILQKEYVDKNNPVIAERAKLVKELPKEGLGLEILKNGVNYIKQK